MYNEFYKCADEDEDTNKLEEEELSGAVDDSDEDEGEDIKSDGQKLYEYLRSKDLVTDGEFDDLARKLRDGWNEAALYLQVDENVYQS